MREKIKEARRKLEWIEEHLEAVGGENKDVYIAGIHEVDALLEKIQKKMDK